MKKEKIATLLLALLLVWISVSCGNSNPPSDANSSGDTINSNTKAGKPDNADASTGGKTVTLTFMGWEASPLETQAVKDGIAKFEDQYPNIKVDYTPTLSGAEYTAKLLASHAGGSMPDVMFMQATDYRTFASKGVIADITDRFDDDYSLDDFIPSVQEEMIIDGKVYGIQSCIVTPVLYYNKDIFDEAGVKYPGTESMQWEDFRQLAIQLTSDDIFGVYGTESTGQIMNALLASNGARLFNEDYNSAAINTADAKEAFEKIRNLRYDDKAALDATTLENIGMSANQMLQTGKVAMVIDGSWALQELAKLDFNVGMAPIPYFKKPVNMAQAHLHAIATKSKHQNEAWEFLKFLSGMDYQGELVSQGLWMPNRKSMYEEDVVKEWYSEDVHGEYIDFLDYFINAEVDPSALQKSTKCGDIVTEETDKYYKDGGDVNVMLQNMETRINEVLSEMK
ncbi:sugar ABC transporter substrate-binding protein [Muricomes intestini]|jgi:multiple sugar transport system substrate-binding protein|uniref:ABC transporter substrate-binding protein n=1 Tax=Muricomes intestini TaxID=1796634 RepID=UPI002FE2850D